MIKLGIEIRTTIEKMLPGYFLVLITHADPASGKVVEQHHPERWATTFPLLLDAFSLATGSGNLRRATYLCYHLRSWLEAADEVGKNAGIAL